MTQESDIRAHAVPRWILLGTWISLLVLTVLTVGVTWIDLGTWNLWLAMAIATAKAMLVGLFFMHLAFDRPINALYLLCALVFVGLFVSLSLLDSIHYNPDVINYLQATP